MRAIPLTLLSVAIVTGSLIREERQVDQTACQQADLVFVLDVSNSIGSRANFEKGLQFVNKIIDLYEIGEDLTRVGVATFAEDAELRFKLNQFKTKNDIMNALNQIPYPVKGKGEATLIYRGLNMAKSTLLSSKNGARDNVPDIVVVITDGETRPIYIQQEVGKAKTQKEASMLRKMGAAVFAIGVSDNVDKDELTGMVGGKGERYLKADSYEDLNTALFFKDIKYKLCKDPTKQCRGKKMDIAFVLDQSSSLHEEKNFKKELSFVTDVVERISMSNDETRVAVVKFSTNAILEVPLNMYHDAQELKKKVLTISWEGGETYLRKAIDMVADRVFKAANGARSDAEKLVVVITDGVSKERVRTKEAIKRLHGMGTNVFAIGVGPEVDMKELEKISTNSQSYKVDNINALDAVQSILNDQVCPNNTERCYQQPLEVCFMLDSSTSLNSAAMFYKELGFVAGLSQRFDIGEQNTRFSVISFSNDSVLNVKLTDSVSKKALQQKVLNIDYMTGDTYTDKAVNLMLSEGFEGARPNIPKIGVVITDGEATDPHTLKKVLKKVKKAGIQMIAIGVGEDIDQDQLNMIAGDKDRVFPVLEGVGALKFIEDNLIKTVCNAAQTIMSYTMPFPK